MAIVKLISLQNSGFYFSFNSETGKLNPVLSPVDTININYIPTETGNTLNLNQFVIDINGKFHYIDSDGTALQLSPNLKTVNGVSMYGTGDLSIAAPPIVIPDSSTIIKGLVKLSGDIGGTAENLQVKKLNGVNVPTTAPIAKQVLTANTPTSSIWTTLFTTIKLASNFTSVSIVRENIPGFTFNVVAGKTYKIEFIGQFSSSSTKKGISLGVVSTGVGVINGHIDIDISNTGSTATIRTSLRGISALNTLTGSFATSNEVSSINTEHSCYMISTFNCINSGTFSLQFGSEVLANSVTLLANSVLLITEI